MKTRAGLSTEPEKQSLTNETDHASTAVYAAFLIARTNPTAPPLRRLLPPPPPPLILPYSEPLPLRSDRGQRFSILQHAMCADARVQACRHEDATTRAAFVCEPQWRHGPTHARAVLIIHSGVQQISQLSCHMWTHTEPERLVCATIRRTDASYCTVTAEQHSSCMQGMGILFFSVSVRRLQLPIAHLDPNQQPHTPRQSSPRITGC